MEGIAGDGVIARANERRFAASDFETLALNVGTPIAACVFRELYGVIAR